MEKIRLNKLMSLRGIASRREADSFIEKGWVSVDGEIVKEIGIKVSSDAQIELVKSAQRYQDQKVTILLNKPIGFVSTQPENNYREALELITPDNQYGKGTILKPYHLRKLAVVGRLDIESQGLLLFTQDGRLAKQIIGSDTPIEKEYIIRFIGTVDNSKLNILRNELSLDEKKLKPAIVDKLNEQQLRFVLKEGKKRQIRRMCEQVNLKVTKLQRVRIGNIRLSKLPIGKWRFLLSHEKIL